MMSETGAVGAVPDNPMAAQHTPAAVGGDADAAAIEEALRDVIDPELGINCGGPRPALRRIHRVRWDGSCSI